MSKMVKPWNKDQLFQAKERTCAECEKKFPQGPGYYCEDNECPMVSIWTCGKTCHDDFMIKIFN